MTEETSLESKLRDDKTPSARKIIVVDTAGVITYSLIVGSILDYCAGLNPAGILASRTSAIAINSVTSGPYGWWREKAFSMTRTTEKSGKVRKTLVDLLAFNTFQVPFYAGLVAVGSLVSEGRVDMEKVKHGAAYVAAISPLISPTLGWYLDRCRRLFGVKSAAEGAYTRGLPP